VSPAGLTVLSGPTAVGKGTVVARVAADHPEIFVSVSATTRPPRPGEVDGRHYLFVSPAQFDTLIAEGALLEWAVVHGVHRYGTPRGPVLAALAAGRPALLEIDLQGARQVRTSWPTPVRVPRPAVVGGTGAPPGGARHRIGRGTGTTAWPRRGRRWPPRRSSTTSWSTEK
jgi:hypothetical protein